MTAIVGEVTLSQQLFDRAGPGTSIDAIVGQQLREQLDAAIDVYVLQQALANAGSVTDASSLTIPLFYSDVAAAREVLTDTAGTRLQGTHAFSTSDLFSWVTKQTDSSGRPIARLTLRHLWPLLIIRAGSAGPGCISPETTCF